MAGVEGHQQIGVLNDGDELEFGDRLGTVHKPEPAGPRNDTVVLTLDRTAVMLYTSGRVWIELLRIDTVNHLGPFRLNVWTAMMVVTVAAAYAAAGSETNTTMTVSAVVGTVS